MRLLAVPVARKFGLKLEEQFEFWADGQLISRAELGVSAAVSGE
ncbi:hypothetical protein Q0N48_07845 [Corynebacterium ureicelerivorans]|nr:hypothetical protein [Corynebacterium ureicelerivorans]MDN8605901.1 hypothetical protein [Corynebacterium ureicelerivorans]